MILVGDVGGTNTRLALARRNGQGWEFLQARVKPTPADIGALVAAYLAQAGGPAVAAAGLCAAGPLRQDGAIHLTNTDCVVDPARLASAIGGGPAIVANDFAAVAHGLRGLGAGDLSCCGGGAPQAGAPCLVVGAGTGLGVASVAGPARAEVLPGEGGHASLAPADADEGQAWAALFAQQGRVSAETVLSGPGLERLYRLRVPGSPRQAAQIAQAAWDGDLEARHAVRLFTRWLGHFCGSLALTLGAAGGVYIAGGIVPGWGPNFDRAAFRAAFEDHQPFAQWLAQVPVFIVTHPFPGLLGMAMLAEAALRLQR
ncbi:MAG: ROK family protein [Nevskia sp.]|nr:ROK family protein [Nevskia sp.]